MNFLKKVTAAAIAVLMVIFLNNVMATVFDDRVTDYGYNSAYEECRDLMPVYGETPADGTAAKVNSGDQKKYDECYKEKSAVVEDKQAVAYQQGLIRAFVVMLLAVAGAAMIFRRYPYLSGGLIAGGILFLVIYPLMNMTGFGGWGYSTGTTSAIQQQLQTTKLILATIGFIGLVAADLFFFEKEPKEPTKLA